MIELKTTDSVNAWVQFAASAMPLAGADPKAGIRRFLAGEMADKMLEELMERCPGLNS